MGELGDLARTKNPFVRIEIGQSTEPLFYKAWKSIVNSFGQDSFRYILEQETEVGMVQKNFDNPSLKLAEEFDKIPFGSKVIISRQQKLDKNGNVVEGKSVYSVKKVE